MDLDQNFDVVEEVETEARGGALNVRVARSETRVRRRARRPARRPGAGHVRGSEMQTRDAAPAERAAVIRACCACA